MKTIIKALIITLLFANCTPQNNNNKLLIGNWVGTSWMVGNEPSKYNAALASFNFNDSGAYKFIYDVQVEKGTYKVENDMLFTKPTNQQEIMVKIVKLTPDSVVFDMNRGGQPEQLTLLRK